MADESTATAPATAPVPAAAAPPQDAAHTDGETSAPTANGDVVSDIAHDQDAATNGDKPTDAADATDALADDSGATPGGKDKKRKSIGGVPEHKAKKLNKKKSMPTLHLECQPGEYYWARLKGYPPWPSIVCDEAMLPESLLATRPVSTARPDGSIRDDFKEGGKNAKERTFPIMFLATNEFQWMVNTSLTPLDPEECKAQPSSKMTKALQEAWKIASEKHDLAHFKDILSVWQEEEEMIRKQEEEAQAEAERVAAEKAAKAEQAAKDDAGKSKKKARKSKAADEDIDMVDAETPKSSKKRKKEAESDGDSAKPKKTPKVTKLNAPKTPGDEGSAAKKAAPKSKKKVVTAPKQETEDEAKPQLSEAEQQQNREKAVLYLRHRLQKGFLSRDQAPQDSEMAGMADFFNQLEDYGNLEPAIIRNTKIHKVLKAIVKLASVPKDDEYHFKKRSADMLELWNKSMETDGGDTAPASAIEAKAPEINGDASTPAPVGGEKDEAEAKVGAEDKTENSEEKGASNADQIEQKVEEKKDAVAGDPPAPPPTSDAGAVPSTDAKETSAEDKEMADAPAAA